MTLESGSIPTTGFQQFPEEEADGGVGTIRRALALSKLQDLSDPIYALVDAARDDRILTLLQEIDCEYECLYQGASAKEMAEFSPYLIRLPQSSLLIYQLISKGWGKHWGIYITSWQEMPDIRRHFRQFTQVQLPNGKIVNFRFYDPRVLRVFLPACNDQEVEEFFGGATGFYCEAAQGSQFWEFRRNSQKLVYNLHTTK